MDDYDDRDGEPENRETVKEALRRTKNNKNNIECNK